MVKKTCQFVRHAHESGWDWASSAASNVITSSKCTTWAPCTLTRDNHAATVQKAEQRCVIRTAAAVTSANTHFISLRIRWMRFSQWQYITGTVHFSWLYIKQIQFVWRCLADKLFRKGCFSSPCMVLMHSKPWKSHSLIVISAEQDASSFPVWSKEMSCTESVWPFSVRSKSPVS